MGSLYVYIQVQKSEQQEQVIGTQRNNLRTLQQQCERLSIRLEEERKQQREIKHKYAQEAFTRPRLLSQTPH